VRDPDSPEPAKPPPPVQATESIVRPSHAGPATSAPGPVPPIVPAPGSLNLEDWFATPQGAYVLNWEMARVDQVVADIFGYYAVQVGLPGIDFLRASRVTSRLTASLRGTPSVVADAHELPFENESLDLVVLPHLLEFSSEPHQILREVERVLRPEGQVVILCFNPVSLWGVKKLFAAPPHAPWSGEFVSVLRMKDWLKLLNFEMRGGRFGCYRPPYTSEKWLGRLGFLEHAGDRWWPVAGAVYLMQAKKRVRGMRIITPAWRKERHKAEALAPSTNGANRGNHGTVTHAPQPVHHTLRNPKDPE
jgi:SAM-dependent methyltransferase